MRAEGMMERIGKRINQKLLSPIGVAIVKSRSSELTQWIKRCKELGVSDIHDYLENAMDNMASKAMRELFSHDLKLQQGKILEVGAGTGRMTREIVKYIPEKMTIISVEMDREKFKFLKKYIQDKHYTNVIVKQGDYFNNDFMDEEFQLVMLPWFDMTLSLYKWGKVFKEARRLLKRNGLLVFDFMDSQDDLINVISTESNAPYYLTNGKDLEKIAKHFGFLKIMEFNEKFNQQIAKYHVYQK